MTQPQQAKDLLKRAAERQAGQRAATEAVSKRIAQERRASIEAMTHAEESTQ